MSAISLIEHKAFLNVSKIIISIFEDFICKDIFLAISEIIAGCSNLKKEEENISIKMLSLMTILKRIAKYKVYYLINLHLYIGSIRLL